MTATHLTQLLALTGCGLSSQLMDFLQTEMSPTVISDLCVTTDDVPDCDALRSIHTLRDGELARQGQQTLL